jgi:hypothetical protein
MVDSAAALAGGCIRGCRRTSGDRGRGGGRVCGDRRALAERGPALASPTVETLALALATLADIARAAAR